MAFGPILRISEPNRTIELAPFSKEESLEFVSPGMQQLHVTKYLSRRSAPVAEDEYAWHDKVRTTKNQLTWGVWVTTNGTRELIGASSLDNISYSHTNQATSGIQICKTEYWGQGIASIAHRARTWYAFTQMGLHAVKSEVIQGNGASRRALEKVGYSLTHTERNYTFIDGALRHLDHLELLNPNDTFWSQWWGSDVPTQKALEARTRTAETLAWCEEHIAHS